MFDLKGYTPLPGSELSVAPGFQRDHKRVDSEQELIVTIWLRRRPGAPPLPHPSQEKLRRKSDRKYPERADFANVHGASEDDIARVRDFASAQELQLVDISTAESIARRSVLVKGSIENLSKAFRVELSSHTAVGRRYTKADDTDHYVGRIGPVFVPVDLAEVIQGVFGLDCRPIGEPAATGKLAPAATRESHIAAAAPLTPPQIAQYYNFPTSSGAQGQTIGLMEFGGGFYQTDIDAYFSGLTPPIKIPNITFVPIDTVTNGPGSNEQYDKEVTIDIDVAGSVAPGAKIVLYFAPHTEQGWVDAIATAVHDDTNRPSVLSISWGAAELQQSNTLAWTPSGIRAMHELFQDAMCLGVTVLAATGDTGTWCKISDYNAHVLYPASDPGVIACGGTESPDTSNFPANERAWAQSGGGISEVFDLPLWQRTRQPVVQIPLSVNNAANMRGVPDISGYAAPGCSFIYKLGSFQPSGTSITTPLYAGLIALMNSSLGVPVGYINPDLYELAGSSVFRDMPGYRWNSYSGAPGYVSGPGWDACTGLGVADGKALLKALSL